jgi:hypothetical protein
LVRQVSTLLCGGTLELSTGQCMDGSSTVLFDALTDLDSSHRQAPQLCCATVRINGTDLKIPDLVNDWDS